MLSLIFCPDCAEKYIDENGLPNEFYLADFGPQGLEDNQAAVLVSMPVTETIPFLRAVMECAVVPCDGCKVELSISKGSKWFLDRRNGTPPSLQM